MFIWDKPGSDTSLEHPKMYRDCCPICLAVLLNHELVYR